MVTFQDLRKVEMYDTFYSITNIMDKLQPTPYIVIGWQLRRRFGGWIRYPWLKGPKGDFTLLTDEVLKDYTVDQQSALDLIQQKVSPKDRKATGVSMMYAVRIFDPDGTVLFYSPSINAEDAQVEYIVQLATHPQARIVMFPVYINVGERNNGN